MKTRESQKYKANVHKTIGFICIGGISYPFLELLRSSSSLPEHFWLKLLLGVISMSIGFYFLKTGYNMLLREERHHLAEGEIQ